METPTILKRILEIPILKRILEIQILKRIWAIPSVKQQRFITYCGVIFLTYWFIRAPIQYFLIDIMGIYHLMGTFIAGCILTVIGFFISDSWIWAKKDGE